MTIAVETPLQDDLRELIAALNAYLLPLSPVEFQFKMTEEQMAKPDTTVFVARDRSGRAVGCGALKVESADLAEVKRRYTRPELRGRRIGAAILAEIEALARRKGIATLKLETGEAVLSSGMGDVDVVRSSGTSLKADTGLGDVELRESRFASRELDSGLGRVRDH